MNYRFVLKIYFWPDWLEFLIKDLGMIRSVADIGKKSKFDKVDLSIDGSKMVA